MAQLVATLAKEGRQIDGRSSLEFLKWLLAELEIPEESQVLLFSKTSLQIRLISPLNPRALYFNDDIYIGWVPGGVVEIAVYDRELGMVFYEADYRKRAPRKVFVRSNECLSCHSSSRTEGVPGVFVRSVFPDRDGQPLGQLGGFLSNDSTPMENRWGGYYITGSGPGVLHMGNQIYDESSEPVRKDVWHESLEGIVDISRYPQPTSDILPLMMLEHQTRVHNVLIRAQMRYRRAVHFAKAIGANAGGGSVEKTLKSEVSNILDVMLFRDEAVIGGEGMDGDNRVEEVLEATVPETDRGWGLKDSRLHPRLMKYRLSYMIYSEAFAALPEPMREAVLDALRAGLANGSKDEKFSHLGPKEKRRIGTILEQTFVGW